MYRTRETPRRRLARNFPRNVGVIVFSIVEWKAWIFIGEVSSLSVSSTSIVSSIVKTTSGEKATRVNGTAGLVPFRSPAAAALFVVSLHNVPINDGNGTLRSNKFYSRRRVKSFIPNPVLEVAATAAEVKRGRSLAGGAPILNKNSVFIDEKATVRSTDSWVNVPDRGTREFRNHRR